jgi:hypothetical protein
MLNDRVANNHLLYPLTLCLLALFSVFFYLDFDKIYHLPPQSTHHWRQSDGFSMALNYYQFNLSLFKPEMHHLLGGNGRAVGEFPITYYITGQLFRIFGVSYSVFRIVHFLPLFLSLLYLAYFMLKKVNMPVIPVISISVCLFTYPLIAYYGLNFLPNVPSLGFFFLGATLLIEYLFFDTSHSKIPNKLVWSSVMIALSALLKPTSITSYCIFIGIVLIGYVFPRFTPYIKKEKKLPLILSFAGIALLNLVWFYYAGYYKKVNKATYFLIDILPYWNIDKSNLEFINYRIRTLWMPTIAHKSMIWLSALSGIFVMVSSIVKKHYFVLLFFIGSFLLDTLVLLLWYEAFTDHDYYFINLYGFAFVVFVLAMYYIQTYNTANIYLSQVKNVVYVTVLFTIIWNLQQSRQVLEERYAPNSPWKGNFNSYFYDPQLKKFIASLGFTPKTKVISIPDGSTNVTLSLLNLKGVTQLYDGYSWSNDLSTLPLTAKKFGIKYLVLCSPEWIHREDFKNLKTKELGHYESIYFFELLE